MSHTILIPVSLMDSYSDIYLYLVEQVSVRFLETLGVGQHREKLLLAPGFLFACAVNLSDELCCVGLFIGGGTEIVHL